jgi:AhpD family alkylhydroperoxidase
MIEAPRLDITQIDPEAYQHLLSIETLIAGHVEPGLYHLIKLRASQINGCAFCLQMHTDQALRHGEKAERLMALGGWKESPLYSDKERAALAWVDELTLIAKTHASKEAFDGLKSHFSDEEIGWLILAAVQINSWNRIAIACRAQYEPAMFIAATTAKKAPEPA